MMEVYKKIRGYILAKFYNGLLTKRPLLWMSKLSLLLLLAIAILAINTLLAFALPISFSQVFNSNILLTYCIATCVTVLTIWMRVHSLFGFRLMHGLGNSFHEIKVVIFFYIAVFIIITCSLYPYYRYSQIVYEYFTDLDLNRNTEETISIDPYDHNSYSFNPFYSYVHDSQIIKINDRIKLLNRKLSFSDSVKYRYYVDMADFTYVENKKISNYIEHVLGASHYIMSSSITSQNIMLLPNDIDSDFALPRFLLARKHEIRKYRSRMNDQYKGSKPSYLKILPGYLDDNIYDAFDNFNKKDSIYDTITIFFDKVQDEKLSTKKYGDYILRKIPYKIYNDSEIRYAKIALVQSRHKDVYGDYSLINLHNLYDELFDRRLWAQCFEGSRSSKKIYIEDIDKSIKHNVDNIISFYRYFQNPMSFIILSMMLSLIIFYITFTLSICGKYFGVIFAAVSFLLFLTSIVLFVLLVVLLFNRENQCSIFAWLYPYIFLSVLALPLIFKGRSRVKEIIYQLHMWYAPLVVSFSLEDIAVFIDAKFHKHGVFYSFTFLSVSLLLILFLFAMYAYGLYRLYLKPKRK